MFRYLCSYHEVSPGFLKLFLSLGRQSNTQDFHSIGFYHEILAGSCRGVDRSIPELGRSGYEFRTYYKVQAMEVSEYAGNTWSLRQTTMYHSFDLDTYRCFWITIKADDAIRQRILDQCDSTSSGVPSDPVSSFIRSLETHMIPLEWCSEGWKEHIDVTEKNLRMILRRVKAAPIPSDKDTVKGLVNSLSIHHKEAPKRVEDGSWIAWLGQKLTLSKSPNHAAANPSVDPGKLWRRSTAAKNETERAAKECKVQGDAVLRHQQVLEEFSVTEFQDLTSITLKLQEVKLAMGLNMTVLKDLKQSYKAFFQSQESPPALRKKFQGIFSGFSRRITSIERELSIEWRRVEALIVQLEEGKRMVSQTQDAC